MDGLTNGTTGQPANNAFANTVGWQRHIKPYQSVVPGRRESRTAVLPVANYTACRAWWYRHMYVNQEPGLNFWRVTRPEPGVVDPMTDPTRSVNVLKICQVKAIWQLQGCCSQSTYLHVHGMKLLSAPSNCIQLLLSSNVYKCMGVVERTGLIICEGRSRLTWQKYTIRLLQMVLQETQLLNPKTGQTLGLTYWVPWSDPNWPKSLSRWPGSKFQLCREQLAQSL